MKHYEYREINSLLKVSLGTISSVNRSLMSGNGGYQQILESINREDLLEHFFLSITEKLLSVPAKSGMGGGSWRYLRDEVRKTKIKKNEKL